MYLVVKFAVFLMYFSGGGGPALLAISPTCTGSAGDRGACCKEREACTAASGGAGYAFCTATQARRCSAW